MVLGDNAEHLVKVRNPKRNHTKYKGAFANEYVLLCIVYNAREQRPLVASDDLFDSFCLENVGVIKSLLRVKTQAHKLIRIVN